MNKRILAISILMLMMCAMAASVFAEDTVRTYEVTVSYRTKAQPKVIREVTYELSASSPSEAADRAKAKCEYDKEGEVVSCGAPIPKEKK